MNHESDYSLSLLRRNTPLWFGIGLILFSQTSFGSKTQPEDVFGQLWLTPWWDLEFSEGETVEIDCGVYTAGYALNTTLEWSGPSGILRHGDLNNR